MPGPENLSATLNNLQTNGATVALIAGNTPATKRGSSNIKSSSSSSGNNGSNGRCSTHVQLAFTLKGKSIKRARRLAGCASLSHAVLPPLLLFAVVASARCDTGNGCQDKQLPMPSPSSTLCHLLSLQLNLPVCLTVSLSVWLCGYTSEHTHTRTHRTRRLRCGTWQLLPLQPGLQSATNRIEIV